MLLLKELVGKPLHKNSGEKKYKNLENNQILDMPELEGEESAEKEESKMHED